MAQADGPFGLGFAQGGKLGDGARCFGYGRRK